VIEALINAILDPLCKSCWDQTWAVGHRQDAKGARIHDNDRARRRLIPPQCIGENILRHLLDRAIDRQFQCGPVMGIRRAPLAKEKRKLPDRDGISGQFGVIVTLQPRPPLHIKVGPAQYVAQELALRIITMRDRLNANPRQPRLLNSLATSIETRGATTEYRTGFPSWRGGGSISGSNACVLVTKIDERRVAVSSGF
jgi:hypothetical protein